MASSGLLKDIEKLYEPLCTVHRDFAAGETRRFVQNFDNDTSGHTRAGDAQAVVENAAASRQRVKRLAQTLADPRSKELGLLREQLAQAIQLCEEATSAFNYKNRFANRVVLSKEDYRTVIEDRKAAFEESLVRETA